MIDRNATRRGSKTVTDEIEKLLLAGVFDDRHTKT